MDDLVGAIRRGDSSINSEKTDESAVPLLDEATVPLLPKSHAKPLESTLSIVSSLSSTFSRHTGFLDEPDSDEEDEDAAETLVKALREKNKDTTVTLHPPKKLDVDYHKKAKKQLRSIRHPDSVSRSWWYLLVTMVAFYNIVSIPLRLGFRRIWEEKTSLEILYVIDYICDAICILDIVLNFFTAYMSQGECEWRTEKTAKHYLKTVFVFDLICTLPVDLAIWGSVWKHCVARIPRMLRVFKVPAYFSHLERQSSRPYLFTIVKILATSLAINHVFACVYFSVAYYEGFGSTRFVPAVEVEKWELKRQYLAGYWWSTNVITRVGGSPAGPVTELEQGLMLPVAFFTLFFVAFIIGGVSEALNRLGDNVNRFRRKVEAINTYLQAKHIPIKLRTRVKEYFDHLWARGGGQDDNSILRDLPAHLRSEVSLRINGEIVPKVPLFAHCSAGFIKAIVAHLKPHIFAPGDWIVRVGDAGTEMFFISKGDVIITGQNAETLSILGEGDFFGEICLLIDTQRTASARAVTYCDVFALDKKDLSTVLEHFPTERPLLQELAETRIGHDFLRNLIYRDPFFINCKHSFLNILSDTFRFKRYLQGQFVYQYGNNIDSDSAFFVASGAVELLTPAGHHVEILPEGSFYGQLDLLADISSILPPSIFGSGAAESLPSNSVPMAEHIGGGGDQKIGKRSVSLRAATPVTIVFVLKKKELVKIVTCEENIDQIPVLEQAVQEALAKAKSRGEDLDSIAANGASAASVRPKYNSMDNSDLIGKAKHGTLKKQMSAFLKSPLEAAREIMRAKQRSQNLARKVLAQTTDGTGTAFASTASPSITGISSPAPGTSVSGISSSFPTTPPNTPAFPSSPSPYSPSPSSSRVPTMADPSMLAIETSLTNAVFGSPGRPVSSLSPTEALHMLQVLSALQAAALGKLAPS